MNITDTSCLVANLIKDNEIIGSLYFFGDTVGGGLNGGVMFSKDGVVYIKDIPLFERYELVNHDEKKETLKNRLVKFWWSECQDKDGNVDLDEVDGSNDFSVIPTNSKGMIQMEIGELRSIIDEVINQIELKF